MKKKDWLWIPIIYDMRYKNIIGRWSKKEYRLLRKIGAGSIGEIYLAIDKEKQELIAIKLSKDMMSITKEYNWMKRLGGRDYIPAVYDIDDWESQGSTLYFFSMEYIDGYDLKQALRKNMPLSLRIQTFTIILKILCDMNREGFIYTDLKRENIMIDKKKNLIRFIDFGSVTEIGTSIKEYTLIYDRAYWKKGKRKADLSYQCFSAAILLVFMLIGDSIEECERSLDDIEVLLKKNKIEKQLARLIRDCLKGHIDNCRDFYEKISRILSKESKFNRTFNKISYSIIGVLLFLLSLLVYAFTL